VHAVRVALVVQPLLQQAARGRDRQGPVSGAPGLVAAGKGNAGLAAGSSRWAGRQAGD
jgi:hypothetical protein